MSINLSYTDRVFVASEKLQYLQQDMVDFQNFNPIRFTPQFILDYEAAIIAARDFVDDETVVDGGTSLTKTVQAKLKEAQKLYKIIKYFVEDAFKHDIGIQNKFGLDNYKEIRVNASQMVMFLSNLHAQSVQYQSQLTAVGLNIMQIQAIQTLRDELYTAVNNQSIFSGERLSKTQQRKEIYETMDTFTQETCRAGKLIYEDIDQAKYTKYTIYESITSAGGVQVHNISPNSTEVAVSSGIDSTKGVRFENKGDVDLKIYIVASLQDTATQSKIVSPQETVIMPTIDLSNGHYNVLVVCNTSNQAGKYEVEILEQVAI